MAKVKVREGQSIWDICLQETGGINGLFVIADANGLDIDTPLHTGQMLTVNVDVENRQVMEHYQKQEYRPVNAPTFEELAGLPADFHYPDFHEIDFEAS